MAVKGTFTSGSGLDKFTKQVGAVSNLLSTLGYFVLVIAAVAAVVGVAGRLIGFPMPWMHIQNADLVPVGVFLFCAAFALK